MSPRPALAGLALAAATLSAPAAEVSYTIDPTHTYPSFEADHMGISTWRGKVDRTTGRVRLDRAAGTGQLDVTVDLRRIDFGLPALDSWARGKEFLDVARFPRARYEGTLADFSADGPRRVTGTLSLHGVSRPLELVIDHFRCIPHPMLKREVCGANATGSFKRDDFGLDAGKAYGFDMTVNLRIQVEAVADR